MAAPFCRNSGKRTTSVSADDLPHHHNRRYVMGYEPIDRIQANPREPRIYTEAVRRKISRTLRQFGPLPLVVDPNRVVLSGNIWLTSAQEAGFTEVPVFVAEHLGAAEAEAFMLFQVRTIERGKWDEHLLGQVLQDLTLQPLDFDISITGFDPPEIDLLIEGLDQKPNEPDPADDVPPAGPSVSRLGDLWILRNHRLLCADSLKAESYKTLLHDESAHIAFADPPFNLKIAGHVSGLGAVTHREFAMASGEMSEPEFISFLITALTHMAANSRNGALHFIAMDWRHLYELLMAGRQVYDGFQNLCVWAKDRPGMGSLYRSQHELFLVFKHGKGRYRNNVQLGRFGRNRSNVWAYPGANTFGRGGEEGNLLHQHPTIKPAALIADVLLDASRRGDLVLDPFIGSGSTLIAAEKVGRHARGIEIDPLYVDLAVQRWERWTGEQALLDGDGRTFREVAEERVKEASDEH
jgi:DNA modification methylase